MSEIKPANERLSDYLKTLSPHLNQFAIERVSDTVLPRFQVEETIELRAAYEALKAENEAQAKRIADLETPLTHKQILSACLSYRHDFGLMELGQQAIIFNEAKSWEDCFQKERNFAASKNGD